MAFIATSSLRQAKTPGRRFEEEENTPQGYQGIGGYKLGGGVLGNKTSYTVPSTSGINQYNKSTGGRRSGSGSGGSYEYYDEGPSLYDQYLAQLEAERQKRISAIKDSIRAQVEQTVRGYEGQRPEIQENYQNLKNQSEVERFKQGKMLRESQANRGALGSGAGRQENLAMQNNYGNALNSINQAEQKDLNALNRAIEDVRSQGRMQEALAEADAAGDFSTALNAGYENYANSGNLSSAANSIKRASKGGSSVSSSSGIGRDTSMSTINNALLNSKQKNLSDKYAEIYKRKFNRDDIKKLNGSTR